MLLLLPFPLRCVHALPWWRTPSSRRQTRPAGIPVIAVVDIAMNGSLPAWMNEYSIGMTAPVQDWTNASDLAWFGVLVLCGGLAILGCVLRQWQLVAVFAVFVAIDTGINACDLLVEFAGDAGYFSTAWAGDSHTAKAVCTRALSRRATRR